MRNAVLVTIAVLATCATVVSVSGAPVSEPAEVVYGFDVRVLPDEEFEDFLQCGLSVFTIGDDRQQWELPSLRIVAGDANSMQFQGVDRIEVTFNCAVNAEKTEVTYEVEGQRDGRIVLNHLGTVRFK